MRFLLQAQILWTVFLVCSMSQYKLQSLSMFVAACGAYSLHVLEFRRTDGESLVWINWVPSRALTTSKSWMLKLQRIQGLQSLLSSNNHICSLVLPCLAVITCYEQGIKLYRRPILEQPRTSKLQCIGLQHKTWLPWEVVQTAPHCRGWEAQRPNRRCGP